MRGAVTFRRGAVCEGLGALGALMDIHAAKGPELCLPHQTHWSCLPGDVRGAEAVFLDIRHFQE